MSNANGIVTCSFVSNTRKFRASERNVGLVLEEFGILCENGQRDKVLSVVSRNRPSKRHTAR